MLLFSLSLFFLTFFSVFLPIHCSRAEEAEKVDRMVVEAEEWEQLLEDRTSNDDMAATSRKLEIHKHSTNIYIHLKPQHFSLSIQLRRRSRWRPFVSFAFFLQKFFTSSCSCSCSSLPSFLYSMLPFDVINSSMFHVHPRREFEMSRSATLKKELNLQPHNNF